MTDRKRAGTLADELSEIAAHLTANGCLGLTTKIDTADLGVIAAALRAYASEPVAPDGLREAMGRAIYEAPRRSKPWGDLDDAMQAAFREQADAALIVISAAGYVIVPREPTDETVHEAMRIACRAKPVGGSDGCGTVVLSTPTFSSMKDALRAALATEASR